MRLVFICSGLEPGRDGVGDFARTLARECAAAGHSVRLAAVRDEQIRESTPAAPNELRLRDIFRHPEEMQALALWLREFNPDWASVQYTPFGFHPRGLGGRRAVVLRHPLPVTTHRHIMLHEIWLQPGVDGALRHRALGWAQRRSVDAWTGPGWQPAVVHTQARLHQARLQARGVDAKLLPLCTAFKEPAVNQAIARANLLEWLKPGDKRIAESGYWLGHFGAFHPQNWDFTAFAQRVAAQPKLAGRRPCFLALGRSAAAKEAFAQAGAAVKAADFLVVGELTEDKVPIAMRACDTAFTSTPWDIIEKSSAVAAWRALDVPVLVTRAGATDASELPPWPDPGLILVGGNAEFYLPGRGELEPPPTFLFPEETARIFLAALSAAPGSAP